jgi:soluble lytic murein transglycosylase-like protein
MINRFNGASKFARTMAAKPVTWTSVAKTARGFATGMQHTLTVVGLSALAVVAVLYTRPDAAHQLSQYLAPAQVQVAQVEAPAAASGTTQAQLPADTGHSAATASTGALAPVSTRQQKMVTTWLAKRYRVAGDATNMLVSTAYTTAKEVKIDPLLILAVMAIESGLNPFAESPVGAQGLMQVMSKIHHAKFQKMGGIQTALNPVANIRVGAQILKEYVNRGGSVEAGLKTYVGAAAFETDQGYGSKVLAEYKRLKLVADGKTVPTFTPPAPSIAAPAAVVAKQAEPVAAPQAEPAPAAIEGEQLAGLQ